VAIYQALEKKYYNFGEARPLENQVVEITRIETDFDEKFGVPRQSGMIHEARGVMRFCKSEEYRQALFGLEQCSHLWLISWFHQIEGDQVKPRVRPPRLGGDKSLGVFSTRSPFRPNPIGLSLVQFNELKEQSDCLELWVSGVDLVNGTPILDIKPYLPEHETVEEAKLGWVEQGWEELNVVWSALALKQVENEAESYVEMVTAVLRKDPRPAYHRDKGVSQSYGLKLRGKNVKFTVKEAILEVDSIV
jgi:tRNA-Thr(GGU) m(6)t(6)A37 methyltransferase TsaA